MAQIEWSDEPGVARIDWNPETPPPEVAASMAKKGLTFSKTGQIIKEEFVRAGKEFLPVAAGTLATAFSPVGPLTGPMARMITGPAAAGLTKGLMTGDVGEGLREAGKTALTQLGGEALGGLARGGASILRQHQGEKALTEFAGKQATKVAEALKKAVPAWKDMPGDAKGLWEMLYSPGGQRALHQAYDASLKQVVQTATGTPVAVPAEVARALKLATTEAAGPLGQVTVDAGKLAEAMTGMWTKQPGAYRAAARVLDDAGLSDPAARAAYRTAQGVRNFLDKTRAMPAEGVFNPMAAQAGLSKIKPGDELIRRNLDDVFGILRTPPPVNLQASPLGAKAGMAGGFLAGGAVGHPFLGAHMGETVGAALAPQSVPLGPLGREAARMVPGELGLMMRQLMPQESTGP